jgi:HTH-type transcriptional regulator/antitoxin HigA
MTPKNFDPNWVSPTGDTILDILNERGWTVDDFATKMDITQDIAIRMISGIDPIYPPTSVKLQAILGGTVSFWLNREMEYRKQLIKKGISRGV